MDKILFGSTDTSIYLTENKICPKYKVKKAYLFFFFPAEDQKSIKLIMLHWKKIPSMSLICVYVYTHDLSLM